MFQNTYFCAPNPQSQAYIQYQGINFYPMNFIYAPTSENYFVMSDFHENRMHQLFSKSNFEEHNHQNEPIQIQKSTSTFKKMSQTVKIQANDSSLLGKADEDNEIPIKTQQIEGNQHSCFERENRVQASKSSKQKDLNNQKTFQRLQRGLCTRKGTQQMARRGRSSWWKQMDDQIQSDEIGLIKESTKQLIYCMLKEQDIKSEAIQSIKNDISDLMHKRLQKQRKTTQQFLEHLIKILSTKFSKFKKTKQEMIKYIFRRIFNTKNKPQEVTDFNWKLAQKMHKQNSSTFKSMNMKFVEKQFQSPIFVHLFSIFLENFQDNFEKENEDRIEGLSLIITSAIVKQEMSELKSQKKLPWNKGVVRNIQKLFSDLKEIQRSTRQRQITMEQLGSEEDREMQAEDEDLGKKKDLTLFRSNTNQSEI